MTVLTKEQSEERGPNDDRHIAAYQLWGHDQRRQKHRRDPRMNSTLKMLLPTTFLRQCPPHRSVRR